MLDGKPAIQSVTMWGGFLAVLSWALPLILPRVGLTSDDGNTILHDIDLAGQVIGSIMVIWGRVKATRPITSITTPKA